MCCCEYNNLGMGFLGGGCGFVLIIFLLIVCGLGLLNCSLLYLIILLFILFGGCLCGFGKGMGSCCC